MTGIRMGEIGYLTVFTLRGFMNMEFPGLDSRGKSVRW